MKRRDLIKGAIGAAGSVLAAPMLNRGRFRIFAQSPSQYSARTIDLVGRTTTIDMMGVFDVGGAPDAVSHPEDVPSASVQRFKEMGVSIYHGGPGNAFDRARAVVHFARWNGFLAHHADLVMRIDTLAKLNRVKGSGKLGVLLGLQNSTHFEAVNDVDTFYGLGQRVSQLTYNERNLIGNGCTARRDDGLSDFGVAIVERMNKLGMAIDVSHSGDRTTLDAIEVSKKPVLITHSNCRALNPGHPRCKTDDAIRRMSASGGVFGVTMIRVFVNGREPTSRDDVLDHFDHVVRLVGVEHVGVGSDIGLEGKEPTPQEWEGLRRTNPGMSFRDRMYIDGLNHPKRLFDLTEGFVTRKYTDKDIEGILGGNFRRALTEIWPPSQVSA